MKVAKVYAIKDLRLEEVEKPTITRPDDVLIKTKYVGICGSDVHIYHGANPLAILPRIMGHEVVGVVEDMGKEVKGLAVGDHIVVEPISYCGKCYACRNAMPNVCASLLVFGVQQDGGMREYFTLPQKQIHKLNKNLAWEEAILTEPFTIGANATLRGNVGAGDRVVVFGAGPIGISILKLAKIKGATVMITDLVDDKLEYAKKNGADVIVNTSKVKLEDAVNEWTKGEGANKVIDAVCIPKMLEVGLDILSVAGTFVNLSFGAAPAQIPGLPITKKQLTIAGSRLQSYQFENVIRLMEAKKLQGDGLVTNIWDFADIQKAFDTIDEDPTKIRKGLLKFF